MNRVAAALTFIVALSAAVIPVAAEEIDFGKLLSGETWSEPAAGDAGTDAEEQERLSALYCDRFGPDYKLVAGTTTCIKIGGHVQMDVYIRGRR